MTQKEFLLKKHQEMAEALCERDRKFNTNPSTVRFEPFKIADGLYYVGDRKVCIHLIDTNDGLILIDSGYLGAAHLLVDSIWRAGFDPANIRWIIHTHGHYDHFGASEEFRRMFGAKLAISRVDAESLRLKPHRSHINDKLFPYAYVPDFDYEIEDGEILEHGNTKIRCILTPGHTIGVLSLFFEVFDNGKKYLAGMFGGAGLGALTLPNICYNENPLDCPQQMLSSIEKVWDEPVEIHLGNHPHNNKTLEKRKKQLEEGGNPFINSNSWHNFLIELKANVENTILENEKLEKEMNEIFR